MSVEFSTSLDRVKQFGLVGESYKPKNKKNYLIKINSIEEKIDKITVDVSVSVKNNLIKQDKLNYKKENLTTEENLFLGLAFVSVWEENQPSFLSSSKMSESEIEKLKKNAKKFLELATEEDFGKMPNKKYCLTYYLIAKYKLYDYKENALNDLYNSLNSSDIFADFYNLLIEFENYSIKKIAIAKNGLKKFPNNERLMLAIVNYYQSHNKHKKVIDFINEKKKIIPKKEWEKFKNLRIKLIFSLLELKKFDEAEKELNIPLDLHKSSSLFLKGFIQYQAEKYKEAEKYFIDIVKITNYHNSSELVASYYFLMGCYNELNETSELEELITEINLDNDFFWIEELGFYYLDNIIEILENILNSKINEVEKAKISGLLAYLYFEKNKNREVSDRVSFGRKISKKEQRKLKKSLSLLRNALTYYPNLYFFNKVYSDLCNYTKDYEKAVIFDLKQLNNFNIDEEIESYGYTELTRCSENFIDNYVELVKNNVINTKNYIENRLEYDIEVFKKLKKYYTISELYYFLKDRISLDIIANTEKEKNQDFLFDIAYSLKECADPAEAKIVYEKYIEIIGESSSVLNNLAIIYEEQENQKEAIKLIKKAKKLSDNDVVVDRNYKRLVSNSKNTPKTNSEKQERKAHNPSTIIEKGIGYFKYYKQGKKIKVGYENSRHFKLLKFLIEPINTAKTIDSVFDVIKIPKDRNDSMLNSSNIYQTKERKVNIISYAIKELQKKEGLKGRLKFELDKNQGTYRLNTK